MDKQFAFTESRVADAAYVDCKAGYALYWDTETPNLGLRVNKPTAKEPKGRRRYVFDKHLGGRAQGKVRLTIGDPKSWPLKKARERARKLAIMVDEGADPRAVIAAELAQADAARTEAERQDVLVSAAWAAYIEANAAHWGERHLTDHHNLAHLGGERKKKRGGKGLTKPGPLASLMVLKLPALTSSCIESWLKRESAKRPTNTAQAYRLLRAFIRWAHDVKETDENGAERYKYRGLIPDDAYSARGVRKAVPAAKTKGADCLQKEQLPAWFGGVRGLSNPVITAYLQSLLLTGARRESLAALLWDDVDFVWGTMTLRTTAKSGNKGGSERTVPLTPFVASLLSTLPRRNEWVFSSEESASGRLMEPTKSHNAALKSAKLPHRTLNGLRRTFCTLAEWVDPPAGVINQLQGRKPKSTEVDEINYKRRDIGFLRMWHEKIEAWFLTEAGIAFTRPGEKPRLSVVQADGTFGS